MQSSREQAGSRTGRQPAAMYFQVTLKRNMLLHPRNFGPKMREVLRANLKKEVEGTCNGRYGYIVLVTKIHEGEGFQVPCPPLYFFLWSHYRAARESGNPSSLLAAKEALAARGRWTTGSGFASGKEPTGTFPGRREKSREHG